MYFCRSSWIQKNRLTNFNLNYVSASKISRKSMLFQCAQISKMILSNSKFFLDVVTHYDETKPSLALINLTTKKSWKETTAASQSDLPLSLTSVLHLPMDLLLAIDETVDSSQSSSLYFNFNRIER